MNTTDAPPLVVVPVIDLRRGVVVRARAGAREAYEPIRTGLSRTADPVEVALGLLAAVPAQHLYIADLDAIEGGGDHGAAIRRIAAAAPGVELWVDAGFATEAAVRDFLNEGLGRVVLGSESQRDERLVQAFRDDAVLSLDFRGEAPLGPAALHQNPSLWPSRVIVMTLARVGTGAGPDHARLVETRRLAPQAQIFAAGGLRGPEDIAPLRALGMAGALVASAIHDGRLRREHLPEAS